MAQQTSNTKRNKYQIQEARLPLIGAMTNRSESSTKDQRFINIFPETRKVEAIESTRIFLNKRPGLTLHKDFGEGSGRGAVWFRDKFYVAVDGNIYEDGSPPVSVITLTDATSKVGMLLANSTSIGDYLFICDGTKAWIIYPDGTVAVIGDYGVGSVTIDTAGAGYVTAPKVYFTGSGSGAAATTTLTTNTVTNITMTSSGMGYITVPTVAFSFVAVPDNVADTLTYSGHNLTITDQIKLSTTGTIPTGLNTTTAYFVINPTATTFQLALTSGGAAINFTTDGTGTLTVITGAPTTQATATAVANNFPTPHVPTPVFIDGYVLLAKGSDIYNCTLDNPIKWASGEYISAEMFPDPVVALARQNNQIVAFGEYSTEFFYDAANVSGSPLNRNESTILQVGCAFPFAVYQNEKSFIFVGQSDSGGRAVWQVDGFQPKKVSDEYVDRILDKEPAAVDVFGFGLRTLGHLLYIVNLPTLNRTLVYDTEEKLWHEWSSNIDDAHTVFAYNYMVDNQLGSAYLLHKSNGTLCKLDTTNPIDVDTNIISEIVTNRYDMDTYKRKFMTNIRVVGDRYTGDNTINLRWTDDDYQTWSNFKPISLTDDFPNFARLGSFRRRAFNLRHALPYALRLENIEVSYYEGDS